MESFLTGRSKLSAVTAETHEEAVSGFQSFFTRPQPAPSENSSAPLECEDHADPQIELVQGVQGIERIIIKCSCGKRIELKCEYEEAP